MHRADNAPVPAPTPPEQPPGDWTWESLMQRAQAQAQLAADLGEVPVGAVLMDANGHLLAEAHNGPISTTDPTAHAEVRALRKAAKRVGNYRLDGCILAVTLEPCMMCAGALVHARVAGVVYGGTDPKSGALISRMQSMQLPFFNHYYWTLGGILAEQCAGTLRDFFRARRK